MLFLRRPSDEAIKQLLLRRRDMNFSYPYVGATRSAPPPGWRTNHKRKYLGTGRAIHDKAVEVLFSWKPLAVCGLEVFSQAPEVHPQADVAMVSRHFGIWSVDFCRVIYVLKAEREESTLERTGFGYGTLPGHAVRGEEAFSIEWHPASEEVWYDIYSFSLPARPLVRAIAPIARAAQRRFALASLEKAVEVTRRPEMRA